jgi:hypothetical protein
MSGWLAKEMEYDPMTRAIAKQVRRTVRPGELVSTDSTRVVAAKFPALALMSCLVCQQFVP